MYRFLQCLQGCSRNAFDVSMVLRSACASSGASGCIFRRIRYDSYVFDFAESKHVARMTQNSLKNCKNY